MWLNAMNTKIGEKRGKGIERKSDYRLGRVGRVGRLMLLLFFLN